MQNRTLPPVGFTKRDIERMTILRRLVAAKRAVEAGYYTDEIDGVTVTDVAFDVDYLRTGVAA